MRMTGRVLAGVAGASLAVTSALAAPVERGSESAEAAYKMGGGASWIGILVVGLVVALAAIAAFGDDDNPVSP